MGTKQNGGAIRFIDLFCGIGGFRFAAEQVFSKYGLSSKCVFSSDIDPYAREAYKANFGEYPSGDITQIDENNIPDHDILFAGFPCQPFSIIGNGKGFDDIRGTLFFDIARILAAKRPKGFILENVKQLIGHNNGKTLKKILQVLRDELGYTVYYKSLNALDYGLPQKRERVIIVGFYLPMVFQFPLKQKTFMPLSEILEKKVDKKHYASDYIREKRWAEHTPAASPSIWHENKAGHISSYPFSCALRAGASYNYLLVDGKRRLTPREMLRLQGFPDTFKIAVTESQTRKQAGNAVPVNIVRAVFESFLPILLDDMNQVNLYPKDSTYQIALAHILREHNDRFQQIPSLANS
jgi:DNA (cytosine-5)-methyltransferase 1